MRYSLWLVAISLLLLAACNGTTAPTATLQPTEPPPDTATPEAVEQEQEETPVVEVSLPPVGEMVSSATEDPEAGLVFDAIFFTQTGGSNNTELNIELRSDGTLVRNGETSTVSQEDIMAIDTMLDELNFFGIQGVFAAAAPNPDVYSYSITVERAGSSMMINAQDTYTPVELKELFAAIVNLAQAAVTPPGQPGG
jgi:hypothetical protein